MEELAHRAEVSKPVVYEHFGGKDVLYAEVVDAEVEALLAGLRTAGAGSPRALLEHATLALLAYVEQRPDGFRVLVHGSTASGASLISEVAHRVEHELAAALAGHGAAAFAGLYAQALVGQVALVGQWWLDDPRLSREEVAAHLVNLAWNGLAHLQTQPGLSAP